ncbi:MAG: MaoC family dehydratase [Gammaproteobacteria bacterium]|nr:MaoC family dehydratase [Gammaproteobacteria bacterium]|tara:strand:+ start:11005 stop:11460 length:456 start_codon:yes stop_codon:yes gene_type:complete
MSNIVSANQLESFVGQEISISEWIHVEQNRIDLFADATGDHQYIHVDPKRAAETPFGTTIAHGFLSLSLLASMNGGLKLENTVMGINYGLDKVRFLSPVKVGAKIRGRFTLISAEEKKPQHFLLKHNIVVEIEGEEKPALIADWLGMTVVN